MNFIDLNIVKMSEQTDLLFAALSLAQASYERVERSNSVDRGPGGKYKYAELSDVQQALKEPFSKNGLSYSQWPHPSGITTMISHRSGQWIAGFLEGANIQMRGVGPQDFGSFLTYMRRYSLAAATGIAQEDDDGQAAQQRSKAPRGSERLPQAPRGAPADHSREQRTSPETRGAAPQTHGGNPPSGVSRENAREESRNEQPSSPAHPRKEISEAQIKRLFAIKNKANWEDSSLRFVLKNAFSLESTKDLGWIQYDHLTKLMELGLTPEQTLERLLLPKGE